MRIITWNCQGAFRNKMDYVLKLNPDLLIVQECESLDKLSNIVSKTKNVFWYGTNKHKGIGIFSFQECQFEILPIHNPDFRFVLPLKVTYNKQEIFLLAIWAMDNKENHNARYIGQVWLAINYYAELLDSSTILIGDFNSNKIWDYKGRIGTHSDVVNKLAEKNIHSVYHSYFNEEQGKEQLPTFYLQRNKNKPYHIDYCFASKEILKKVQDVEVGIFENWIEHSDHAPLNIKFNL